MEAKELSAAELHHAAHEVMTPESFSRALMQYVLKEAAGRLEKQERPATPGGPLTVDLRATIQRRPGGDGCIIICFPHAGCICVRPVPHIT